MQHAERLCDRLLLLARGKKRFEGTLDQARAEIPARLSLVARDTPAGIAGVASAAPGASLENGWREWEVQLEPGVAPGDLLELCTAQRVPLRRFEERRASLHDVFLHIVGPLETNS